MPVQIGQKPDHGFDSPMGLLGDCHRRIEKFLAALLAVTQQYNGGPLDERGRDAVEKSLRYFRSAAPRHNSDEEESLFPRLRGIDDPEVRQLLTEVDRLEADHHNNNVRHEQVDDLARQWLADGTLPPEKAANLLALLYELRAVYQEHIALEDNRVFPMAQRLLTPDHLMAIGREMAQRRGLDPSGPPGPGGRGGPRREPA